ncbi:hypothetical protein MYCTH_52892 [Thermothelomyces thermophilus ATCC 42464]|uniref:Uncharacterized protein n=1 Tax=Thermothelomyces thermophilus (strain ATCC 42464 / BCRC 31852 / DSM 1799) TaxID=573729 RepID=G2QF68_THET4|nr:uncharacterized protein MYCTH_52892 [Thermothelomyces thermophilus ATCC 42464]AEO59097.1 hypothetical protein MYCTH_52892 [Thermothelomyces thermophilus ATCC 42464]
MAVLGRDITLLVSEHVDMDSLARLMLSSRANYRLIRGYERSIVKAKIARLVRDPVLEPPLGAVLSSSTPDRLGLAREVLSPMSFAVARELEARERRIARLLGSPGSPPSGGRPSQITDAIGRLVLFRDLPPRQMERLLDGLRDACRVADRIADCAAPIRLAEEDGGDEEEEEEEDEPWTSDLRRDARQAALEERIHLARQRYIRSLGPVRLAFLALLTSLAGMLYARRPPDPLHPPSAPRAPPAPDNNNNDDDPDPFRWERVIAFKEAFLRHGTVILCALLCPPEKPYHTNMKTDADCSPPSTSSSSFSSSSRSTHHEHPRSQPTRYYEAQVAAVLTELLEYEAGGHWQAWRPADQDGGAARPIPDSLHMTMMQAFRSTEEKGEEEEEEEEGKGEGKGEGKEEGQEDTDGDRRLGAGVVANPSTEEDAVVSDASSSPTTAPPLSPPPQIPTLIQPDSREALILRWVRQR